jgi:hypothetical protein
MERESALPDGFELASARYAENLISRRTQLDGDGAADRADAVDDDSHGNLSRLWNGNERIVRKPLPCHAQPRDVDAMRRFQTSSTSMTPGTALIAEAMRGSIR